MKNCEQIITTFIFFVNIHPHIGIMGENLLSIMDLVSIVLIVGSYAVIAFKIRSELRGEP